MVEAKATAMSSRVALALAAVLALASATALAACGSASAPVAGQASAFAWLRPSPAPSAWHTSRLSNARLAYPLRWRSITSDPGTVSAALRGGTGRIKGYLNATPQQGAETLSNWSSFRPDHNRDEGDVSVKLLASATNLSFRAGHGSCVIDTYTSSTGRNFREIACIVAGTSATTVIVGAAPPTQWPRQAPAIERAISSFLT
jgi:hypothetical protein